MVMYQPETPDDAGRSHDVTLALQAARGGDPLALNEAFHLVYDEVRTIARARAWRGPAAPRPSTPPPLSMKPT